MDLLPTVLGALPDLGVAGVVLAVLIVGQRILRAERAYFTEERAIYRAEAREDRADLRQELKESRTEIRELERALDAARGWPSMPTAELPVVAVSSPER